MYYLHVLLRKDIYISLKKLGASDSTRRCVDHVKDFLVTNFLLDFLQKSKSYC